MKESGSAIFYVLIAVALLGALIYAVSQSGRDSTMALSSEQTHLLATEIIEQSNAIAQAVTQMRLRGTSQTSLCFDDDAWGNNNYDHSGCTDDKNKLFNQVSGGGIVWSKIPESAADSSASPDYLWHFYNDNAVEAVGTTCAASSCADLLLVASSLSLSVCTEINDILGVDNPSNAPPVDSIYGTGYFDGTFSYSYTIGDEDSALEGKNAACFKKTDSPSGYVYYRVLQAR